MNNENSAEASIQILPISSYEHWKYLPDFRQGLQNDFENRTEAFNTYSSAKNGKMNFTDLVINL